MRLLVTILALWTIASTHLVAQMVKDPKHGLLWEDTAHSKHSKLTYKEAKEYCASLKLGNYEDWRLPTVYELLSIVDFKRYEPAIKSAFAFVETEGEYWSNTAYVGDNKEQWVISFKDGSTDSASWTYERYVRCVRDIK